MIDLPKATQLERCWRLTCHATATHSVRLKIPPINATKNNTNFVHIMCGIKLCAAHANSVKAKDLITPDLIEIGNTIVRASHRVPLDFKHAKIEPVPLDNTEWQEFNAKTTLKN